MAKYHVTIVRHMSNQFALCFREMSRLIQWGLQELGHDCTRNENQFAEDRTNIIFGLHEWWKPSNPLEVIRDYDCIIYQAEQLAPGGRRMPDWYFGALHHANAVWDYSPDNIGLLNLNGVKACHVPPAWHEKYEPIDNVWDQEKTIDALFMGALNGRRQYMLTLIGNLVDEVHVLTSTWGLERDEFMAKAKVLLNIHFYGSQTLELLRISHAINSGIPVVSEAANSNPYEDGICMVPYQDIPKAYLKLANSPQLMREQGQRGQDVFRATSMAETIQRALDAEIPPDQHVPDTDQADQPHHIGDLQESPAS